MKDPFLPSESEIALPKMLATGLFVKMTHGSEMHFFWHHNLKKKKKKITPQADQRALSSAKHCCVCLHWVRQNVTCGVPHNIMTRWRNLSCDNAHLQVVILDNDRSLSRITTWAFLKECKMAFTAALQVQVHEGGGLQRRQAGTTFADLVSAMEVLPEAFLVGKSWVFITELPAMLGCLGNKNQNLSSERCIIVIK